MSWHVPLVIRGELVQGTELRYHDERGALLFDAPDPARYASQLTLGTPRRMAELQSLRFDEIVDFLRHLGARLALPTNPWLREAFDAARAVSRLPDSILRHIYDRIPQQFDPVSVRRLAERSIGIRYLDGWVEQPPDETSPVTLRIRAFGVRCLHVAPGTVPSMSAAVVIRNAITRCDGLIKIPANDPLTAAAIVRTMLEMDPTHPLTRHVAVAFWRSGDERVEASVYDPRRIEKVVAWGGFDRIRHISRYLRGGLDLIMMEPKHSAAIVGPEAFESEQALQAVGQGLARDIGTMNQEACFSVRTVYAMTGTRQDLRDCGLRLARSIHEAILQLPGTLSGPPRSASPELASHLRALRLTGLAETVVGGEETGATVVVSHSGSAVDFAALLANRTANLVMIDDVEAAIRAFSNHTQTVSVHPVSLKEAIRDRLAAQGVQRVVTVGAATPTALSASGPQDGIEPLRQLCRWVVDESPRAVTHAGGDLPLVVNS